MSLIPGAKFNVQSCSLMASCSLCLSQFPTVSLLLTHIRLEHADQPNFQIQCNLQGCKRTFSKYTVYRNHLYHFHDTSLLENHPSSESVEDLGSEPECDPPTDPCNFSPPTLPLSTCRSCTSSKELLQNAAARWVLKTSECHKIPQSVMDGIIAEAQSLFETGLYSD